MVASILVCALGGSWNPSMLVVVIYLLSRPHPGRLLLGYLIGTLTISIGVGIAVVLFVSGNASLRTSTIQVSPTIDLVVGLLLIAVGVAVAAGRLHRPRRHAKKAHTHHWSPSVPTATVLGLAHGLPGALYLVALKELSVADPSTVGAVVGVVAINLVLFSWTEAAVGVYFLRPEWTLARLERIDGWLKRHAHRLVTVGAVALGVYLVVHSFTEG